jgi:uncharacterized protein (DUF4415 family)
MAKGERIMRASAEEIARRPAAEGSRTDWQRVRDMSQEEADRLATEEDCALPEGWEAGIVLGVPAPKESVHIRLDADVLRWFRDHGPGYQTRINAVLRGFVEARQRGGRQG